MRYGRVWVPITASAIGVALALPVWSWRSQEASLPHIDQELLALNAGKPYSMMQTTAALDGSLPARVTQLQGAIAQFRQAHPKRDETLRSEELCVGKEWVSTGRYRGSPHHQKKTNKNNN